MGSVGLGPCPGRWSLFVVVVVVLAAGRGRMIGEGMVRAAERVGMIIEDPLGRRSGSPHDARPCQHCQLG
jgi:hypothetical protein